MSKKNSPPVRWVTLTTPGEHAARVQAIADVTRMSNRELALLHYRNAERQLHEFEPQLRDYDDESSAFSHHDRPEQAVPELTGIIARLEIVRAILIDEVRRKGGVA